MNTEGLGKPIAIGIVQTERKKKIMIMEVTAEARKNSSRK